MDPLVATVILLALIAVGELISIVTRARIPMLLVGLMGFLLLRWTGVLSPDLIKDSNFAIIGALMSAPLIIHMGTLIPIKTIKSQYRAVLVSLMGMLCACLLILLIVTPIVGYKVAAAGTGPLTGGLIAFLVTSQKLKALGLTSIISIPALILVFQGLIGMPLTSNLLRKHAEKLRNTLDPNALIAATVVMEDGPKEDTVDPPKNRVKAEHGLIPEKFQTNLVLLFLLFVGAALATTLGSLTGISYSLWALAIGMIGTFAGVFRNRLMERSNAFSVGIAGLIIIVMNAMNATTIKMFLDFLPAVALIIIVGTVGLVIGGFIGAKLFKWDPYKGISVALTALYGFPGDYLISQEVSRSVGRDKQEEKAIFNEILTPMLIGGFTSVTVGSVIIATIIMNTL